MDKEELKLNVELELQWLKYYANSDTREAFDPAKPPYDQLVSIGYTKKPLPLDARCAFLRLTSDLPMNKDTLLEKMRSVMVPRNSAKNVFSALEIYMLKYPEEHEWVKNSLK